jgi:hypothetical protein
VFVLNAEALLSFQDQMAVEIVPNPSDGQVKLKIQNNQGKAVSIQLKDQWGKVLDTLVLAPQNYIDLEKPLNISHLPNGVYFLHIQNQLKNTVKKIVIAR